MSQEKVSKVFGTTWMDKEIKMPDIDFNRTDFGVIKINGVEIKEVEDEQTTEKKSRNTLLTAVFNTKLVVDLPDFTFLVTPVFRAMEFYLHRILHDYLGKETETDKGKNNFAFFSIDEITQEYYYNSKAENLSPPQINYLNKLYNEYNKIRHPYSHWSQNIIDTEVIEDLETARELILTNLKLMNEFYQVFI